MRNVSIDALALDTKKELTSSNSHPHPPSQIQQSPFLAQDTPLEVVRFNSLYGYIFRQSTRDFLNELTILLNVVAIYNRCIHLLTSDPSTPTTVYSFVDPSATSATRLLPISESMGPGNAMSKRRVLLMRSWGSIPPST